MSTMLTRFRFALTGSCIAAVVAVLTSCGDSKQLGLEPRAPSAHGDLFGGLGRSDLLSCSPLPYDSVTQDIGPDGGVIQVGPHTFSVPAGALSETVSITAVAPSGTTNSVRFQPEGLVFDSPASLQMSYANCGLLGSLLPKRIAYTTPSLVILSILPSVDDLESATVTGQVRHFSDYAVAW
jgi:hypothetical protein